jgi:tetratricopeptide (TPR) repeat protein
LKKQFILTAIGSILVAILFFFGRTTSLPKSNVIPVAGTVPEKKFEIDRFIADEKSKFPPQRALSVSKIENEVKRGDVKLQQVKAYNELANFWKDSMKSFEGYAYYTSEAAKLDNSEKNLTFAARIFLENLREEHDEAKLEWETAEAITLFEKAIALNPENDDLRIGLGSCYIYGRGRSGDPQATMKGIQELLTVVRKDSTNMKAQMVLGVGGMVSGQYDKALERFKKVVTAQPDNPEAVAFLADTYAAKGDKAEAIKWYNVSKRLINNPAYSKEADERIKALK